MINDSEMNQDYREMAELLQLHLELLDIHDVWDNAGSTRDGYVDPYELADEMVEEVLKPFLDEWKELTDPQERKTYALELIKGLQQFQESSSEFPNWAVSIIESTIDQLKCG
jgi:putative heme degradation protein